MFNKLRKIARYWSKQITSINNNVSEIQKKMVILESSMSVSNGANIIKNSVPKESKKFSIITAAYNNAEYLEEYFISILIMQDYDVKKNLQIIIVDDGSTDKTATIVEKWKKQYPNIIEYIYQENQGQAVARNTGIKNAMNEWLTFIDADDFISADYFNIISDAINSNAEVALLASRLVYYYEKTEEKRYNHPLDYKFCSNICKSNYLDADFEKNFQLSMSSCFFKKDLIDIFQLSLKNIKPNFEDAYFIFQYQYYTRLYKTLFVKNAEYYYRKRAAKNSTIDSSSLSKAKYTTLLEDAYVRIGQFYIDKMGSVPNVIQNALLYELYWNIKLFEEKKVKLSVDEMNSRKESFKEIFKHIDFENIIKNSNRFWFMYQVGFNYSFYNGKNEQRARAYYKYEGLGYTKIELVSIDDNWEIKYNGKTYTLSEVEHGYAPEELNDSFFVGRYYLNIPAIAEAIELKYDGETLPLIGRIFYEEKKFTKDSILIFFDRPNKADDNAESFYRWMKNEHSEYTNCYFALDRNSSDWERLNLEGFKLVDYNSNEFTELYTKGDFVFSSALDDFIQNYKNLRYSGKSSIKFIFLQHGIGQNDIHTWFNSKKIDQVVCSATKELDIYNNGKFNMFRNEQIHSGFPRFDELTSNPKNKIFFHFTWRQSLSGVSPEKFKKSEYFKQISRVVSNEKLLEFCREKDYEINLLLHPQLAVFTNCFTELKSDIVKVNNSLNVSYKKMYEECSVFITDYSSAYCDVIYLGKPVLFFQFDHDDFFNTHGLYQKGIDHKDEHFGFWSETEEKCVSDIIRTINNNCAIEKKFAENINSYFLVRNENHSSILYKELVKKYN